MKVAPFLLLILLAGAATAHGGRSEVHVVDAGDGPVLVPAEATVYEGAALAFTDDIGEAHRFVGDLAVDVPASGSATWTAATVGTFAYRCEIHPALEGVVHVRAPTPALGAGILVALLAGALIRGDRAGDRDRGT